MGLPLVAIVGRPNVGKSSLLNAAVARRVAIVHDHPGVTRDRLAVEMTHGERAFTLMDTGGIGIVDDQNLDQEVEIQINAALTAAAVIVFVLDVREGVTPLDERVARIIRRTGRPFVVVANKVDGERHSLLVEEFQRFGMGRPFETSALQGFGIQDVLDAIVQALPPPEGHEAAAEPGESRVALVGQRNAGKSTLINALAGEDRVIVSQIPGTTRDSIDVRVTFGDRTFTLIDTAGIRKARKVKDSIEFYSQARAHESIGRADVVIHLMDASKEVSQVDKKIADAVMRAFKPCVLAINKWDLAGDVEPEAYVSYLQERLPLLYYAPVLFVSSKDKTRLKELVDVAFEIHDQAKIRVSTPEVNRLIEEASAVRGPRVSRGKYPRVYYATQVGVSPPWIVLFVNDPTLFKNDFRRFLENRLRRAFPYSEIPLRISFRQRKSILR